MPFFRVKGKFMETGKPRNTKYFAKSEDEAMSAAEADGMIALSVEEIPAEPATERQLAFAAELGITIPDGITKPEISDLISLATTDDKPSTDRHRRFAESFGLEPTQYIGKKQLFDEIWQLLKQEGREMEMLQWFVFRVYRGLVKGTHDAPIDSPSDPLIIEVAHGLSSNEKAVASVRRYDGRNLIWFGEWSTPDGSIATGGSNRTIGYKETSQLLRQRLGIAESTNTNVVMRAKEKPTVVRQPEPNGCAGIVVIVFLLPAGLVAYLICQ
jgi:hypothetical protein